MAHKLHKDEDVREFPKNTVEETLRSMLCLLDATRTVLL